MKTFIQYLNEISPQLAARAFGARMYRTYANPSEHGAKQAGKNFEHMRKRAEAAGLKPDDITKDVERGLEREFYKTPDVRIKQTIGDKKGGKAFELLKRIKKYTSLQNKDTLGESSRGLQRTLRYKGADAPQRMRDQIRRQTMRIKNKMGEIESASNFPSFASKIGLDPQTAGEVAGNHIEKNIARIEKGHAPNIRKLTTKLAKQPGKYGDEAREIVNNPVVKAQKDELFRQKQERSGGVERN